MSSFEYKRNVIYLFTNTVYIHIDVIYNNNWILDRPEIGLLEILNIFKEYRLHGEYENKCIKYKASLNKKNYYSTYKTYIPRLHWILVSKIQPLLFLIEKNSWILFKKKR